MHEHPNYLVYGLEDSTVTFTTATGVSAELEKAGEAMWREAEVHSARTTGQRTPSRPSLS
jgi:hypothetical protein